MVRVELCGNPFERFDDLSRVPGPVLTLALPPPPAPVAPSQGG